MRGKKKIRPINRSAGSERDREQLPLPALNPPVQVHRSDGKTETGHKRSTYMIYDHSCDLTTPEGRTETERKWKF